jgi:hypothetical protein
MATQDLTFEAVDRHVERLKLADFRRGGRHHFTSAAAAVSPGDVLPKVCAMYRAVRPILILVAKTPILPKKWRDVINTFISLMDGICG